MSIYAREITQHVVYSIGDTHGRGREVGDFIDRLRERAKAAGEDAVFVQLGDLCDCFTLPEPHDNASLREIIRKRIATVPGLREAVSGQRLFVDWRLFDGSLREGEVKSFETAESLISCDVPKVLESFYEATMSFETMATFVAMQQANDDVIFVFGNHDADLLRGRSDYGRQQKYIFLGLLGFGPDEVVAHMQRGTPDVILHHPWMRWLNERPHLVMSADTIYMHGGPTGALTARLAEQGIGSFEKWVEMLDEARRIGWDHPEFKEHESFLSPDGAPNDWVNHPACILDFLRLAKRQYLAVGHSPFLDFEKGPLIDLAHADNLRPLFHTPAQLPPDGRLIKHDTNLKRGGERWACRHETGTSRWTGINAQFEELPLRRSSFTM